MTRHGKNATASSVYSYHERQKDTEQSGYGSLAARAGKDSVKEFDACSLTLQPCRNPVVTPHGILYEKESILEYIITKKRELAKQAKAYNKQKKQEEKELKNKAKNDDLMKVDDFINTEKSIISKPYSSFVNDKQPSTSSNSVQQHKKELPSFWIPDLTPQAEKSKVEKPHSKVYCPMSSKPLKMKDLIPVKFTPIADRDTKTSVIAKKNRWMCAVTHDTLRNSVPCAVLRPTGDVVTVDCVEKIIRKNNLLHPITGEKLQESDIIVLKQGGTGFASTNKLDTKSYRPVLMV